MKQFLKQMFSEDGSVSFSRAVTLLIVVFVLGWDTSFVVHAKALPPSSELLGQLAFMTGFYAINKTTGAYTSVNTPGAPPEK